MVFWFFKKRDDRDLEFIHKKLDNSFSNIHNDMEKVTSWINHFHGRHGDHDKKFDTVVKRLDKIEYAVSELQDAMTAAYQKISEPSIAEAKDDVKKIVEEDPIWLELTETQQKLCWKIAVLQKELPNEWLSLKYLAQEMYPDRDYASVRSTVSQFIAQLEDLGFVKRRRKGRQAYVCSTDKNPCTEKVRSTGVKAKAAKKKVSSE